MSSSSNTQSADNNADPLALYTRALYNYTLALWTESRRVAEEKARSQQADQTPISPQEPPGQRGQPSLDETRKEENMASAPSNNQT